MVLFARCLMTLCLLRHTLIVYLHNTGCVCNLAAVFDASCCLFNGISTSSVPFASGAHGLPTEGRRWTAVAFVGPDCLLQSGGFTCPRCKARVVDLPSTCHVCGLTLVSSSQLARSYHHLFPVKPFAEVPTSELPALVRFPGLQLGGSLLHLGLLPLISFAANMPRLPTSAGVTSAIGCNIAVCAVA